MNKFVTSDTHFWHKNILKYQKDERPFDNVQEMNEVLIQRWNEIVKPDDEIYHLGDFAFANENQIVDILNRLNGTKFLIFGNHDHKMKNQIVRNRFKWQKYYHELRGFEKNVVLFHYPIHSWDKIHYGVPHFYGHTHGSIPEVHEGRGKDVGVDTNNLYPYEISELIKRMPTDKFDPRMR